MLRGVRFAVFVCLIALTAIPAKAQSYLPGWSSCQQLIDACKATAADDIYAAALLPLGGTFGVGTCYAFDRTACPTCSCWDYVMISHQYGQKGWDGGGGCIKGSLSVTKAQSRALAAAKIKELCEAGTCCCPTVTPKPCTDAIPIRARDSVTGSCCTFPNSCSVPNGWSTAIPPGACG